MAVRVAWVTAGFLALAAAGAALGAWAHTEGSIPNTAAGRAAAQRHENFKQLGGAFKAIMDELRKDAPDKAVVVANANRVKAYADDLPHWFPKGSGAESGVKVRAKAQVWTDPKGFAAAAQRLQGEAAKLAQAAPGGNLGAVKAQFRATGMACKNCHDKYRLPEDR
jgi:cytochrome c556